MLFGRVSFFGVSRASVRTLSEYVYNKNLSSLEKLTIGYRPKGWHLEKKGREYWHKLTIDKSARHVTASIVHHTGAVPVSASTSEWPIRKYLYSLKDRSAYRNLGRILGRRCIETGIMEVSFFDEAPEGSKTSSLIEELKASGVSLTEPPVYTNPRPSDLERPEKPWELETN